MSDNGTGGAGGGGGRDQGGGGARGGSGHDDSNDDDDDSGGSFWHLWADLKRWLGGGKYEVSTERAVVGVRG